MTHQHINHLAECSYCGWEGKETELPPDPNGHPCGKDQCPECGEQGFIICCLKESSDQEDEDEVDGLRHDLSVTKIDLQTAQQENARLREALEKYGQHKHDCNIKKCTCGLKQALEAGDE